MKILLTLDFPPEKGGIQHYLYQRVAHCYCAGDCVINAGCGSTPALDKELPCPVFSVTKASRGIFKKLALIPLFFLFVKHWFPRRSTVVVECGNVYPALLPWVIGFVYHVPYRIYTHGTELFACKRKNITGYLLRRALCRAESVYANSAFTGALARSLGVTAPVTVEPPRLDASRLLKAAARPPGPIQSALPQLLCVGRLVAHKGHHILLRALALLDKSEQVHSVIVGSGPQEAELRVLRKSLGLEKVELTGEIDDQSLHDCFSRATLFVLPSLENDRGVEGFGIVLLEAMAYHIPIIASACGGIREVLDNGSCGMLVPPGDPFALAQAITVMIHDKPLQERLTRAAYARLETYYVWK
jgi:phosphatidyl-myo-inositol dimannoside synthase